MGSETAIGDRTNTSTRSCSSKRNTGKGPRKIHKAEREKLKRDRMNELFLDLGKAVDVDHPNNGKASVLRETIKLLGELIAQVDNLKKENVVLLSESNYVTSEKNELLEETSALVDQIKGLQREIDERANRSNFDVRQPQSEGMPQLPEDIGLASDSVPIVGPVFVVPLHNESQGFSCPFPGVNMANVPPNVTKPRPRYPSASDSWPTNILKKQSNAMVAEDA